MFNVCRISCLSKAIVHSRLLSFRAMTSNTGRSFFDELSRKEDIVLVEEGDINILAMNYRAKKNALSKDFVDAMSSAVKTLEESKKAKAVLVCSLIPDVFCAGADLKERATISDYQVPVLVAGLRTLFQRIYSLPMPTVAAIDGAALGGGLELALACDVRYAGDLPKTQVGLIETHWALLPGAGGSQRLPRIIGPARAKELIFAARRLSAPEAAHYGVVNDAVDPKDVPEEWKDKPALYHSLKFAEELCSKGPVALQQAKRAINEGMQENTMEDALRVEGNCYRVLVYTKDRKEGMRAFAQKRKPIYMGA